MRIQSMKRLFPFRGRYCRCYSVSRTNTATSFPPPPPRPAFDEITGQFSSRTIHSPECDIIDIIVPRFLTIRNIMFMM